MNRCMKVLVGVFVGFSFSFSCILLAKPKKKDSSNLVIKSFEIVNEINNKTLSKGMGYTKENIGCSDNCIVLKLVIKNEGEKLTEFPFNFLQGTLYYGNLLKRKRMYHIKKFLYTRGDKWSLPRKVDKRFITKKLLEPGEKEEIYFIFNPKVFGKVKGKESVIIEMNLPSNDRNIDGKITYSYINLTKVAKKNADTATSENLALKNKQDFTEHCKSLGSKRKCNEDHNCISTKHFKGLYDEEPYCRPFKETKDYCAKAIVVPLNGKKCEIVNPSNPNYLVKHPHWGRMVFDKSKNRCCCSHVDCLNKFGNCFDVMRDVDKRVPCGSGIRYYQDGTPATWGEPGGKEEEERLEKLSNEIFNN